MKELRNLTAKDLFKVTAILNKIGIGELKDALNFADIQKTVSQNKDVSKEQIESIIGVNAVFDIASVIVKNLDKAEKEIFTFLASVTSSTPKEIEDLSMGDFMELIVAVIRKEEFKDFFKRASSLLK